MPRPKRTKINSTRAPQPKQPTPATPARQNSTKKTSEHIPESGDDSDGLVYKSARKRIRYPWEPEPVVGANYSMSGALAVASGAEPNVSDLKSRSPHAGVSSKALERPSVNPRNDVGDHVDLNLEPQARVASPGTQEKTTSAVSYLGANDLEDTTNFSFTSMNSKSSPLIHPSSALKVHGTPAMETSILANFRRRPRQASILRMVHQNTDVEDNDLTGLDDLDDFNPDDESTPLHLQKRPQEETDVSALRSSTSSTNSKKRKLASWEGHNKSASSEKRRKSSPDDHHESSPTQNRHKSVSPEIHVPRSSPPYDPPSGSDIEKSRATSVDLPEPVAETCEELVPQTQANLELMSETMAPPRSSSTVPDTNEEIGGRNMKRQTRQTRQRKQGMGGGADHNESDAEEERPLRSKGKKKTQPAALSTAKLQSLLPKRRTAPPRERDVFDIDGSDDTGDHEVDSDQDELQRPATRHAPASKKLARSQVIKKGAVKAKAKVRKSEKAAASARQGARTYGRRTSSDKENERIFVYDAEPEEAEGTTETAVKASKPAALAAVAKKFQEVDAWEMEFETVEGENGQSSPWR